MIRAIVVFISTHIVVDGTSKRQLKRQRIAKPKRAVTNGDISPSGRILEEYNLDIIASHYGQLTANIVSRLPAYDANNTDYTPKTLNSVQEWTVLGNIKLGYPLSVSTQSIIFTIKDSEDLLIKYQANCIELDLQSDLEIKPLLHPSVTESIFTQAAWKLGLGPRIHALSPPTSLCESMNRKCGFDMPFEAYEMCVADSNSSFRYLIMSRVPGENLGAYKDACPDGIVPMERALLIGEALIAVLERIHREGQFVHGDIHLSNIMLESESRDAVKISLIDFARSFQNIPKPTDRIRPTGWSAHPLYSYWEIDGFLPSARDDVARAVEVVARLMLPEVYFSFEMFLAESSSEFIMKWKREANIFRLPAVKGVVDEEYDPVEKLRFANATRKDAIRSHLGDIMKLVRNMTDINGIPPYAAIRESFAACRNLTRF
jgi:hypothetical protein